MTTEYKDIHINTKLEPSTESIDMIEPAKECVEIETVVIKIKKRRKVSTIKSTQHSVATQSMRPTSQGLLERVVSTAESENTEGFQSINERTNENKKFSHIFDPIRQLSVSNESSVNDESSSQTEGISPKVVHKEYNPEHIHRTIDIDMLLEKEKQFNKTENWNKLDKTIKIQKLHNYAEKYGRDNKLPATEIKQLKQFFVESMEKQKLQKAKDVTYNKDTKEIIAIPSLYFNQVSHNFTLKNVDPKRVSTLKSLTPKR